MSPDGYQARIDLAVEAVLSPDLVGAPTVKSDEEIGQVGHDLAMAIWRSLNDLSDAMKKVGKEGVITVEEAKSLTSTRSRRSSNSTSAATFSP